MSNSSDFLATFAMQYLEDVIVPIVIEAARLSPETGIEEFLDLNLTKYTSSAFAARSCVAHCEVAGGFECEERTLLVVSIMAMRLANSDRANKICRNIMELMMRDAVELHAARDLAFSTNLVGVDNSEFELRYQKASKIWQKWEETDDKIMTAQKDFLLDISDFQASVYHYFG